MPEMSSAGSALPLPVRLFALLLLLIPTAYVHRSNVHTMYTQSVRF